MALFWGSKEHTEKMADMFSEEINECVEHTTIYREVEEITEQEESIELDITVEDLTTSGAIVKYKDLKNLCALNFASFFNPGGSFGNVPVHLAQEEYICKDSFLYNVLKEFQSEYNINKELRNKNLYRNFALYSPDVIFVNESDEEEAKCDILTCAAPNATAAGSYHKVTNEDIENTMYERIDFLLTVAKKNDVRNIILGAFGCGVFGNDPNIVSKAFKELLQIKDYGFDKVIFAIPDGYNLKAFKANILGES